MRRRGVESGFPVRWTLLQLRGRVLFKTRPKNPYASDVREQIVALAKVERSIESLA